MRHGAMGLAMVLLLVGLLAWTRPTGSQEPLPTPRGQLGGREPLGMTPAFPSPVPTVPATATPPATGTPVASPPPIGSATPTGVATPVADAGPEHRDG